MGRDVRKPIVLRDAPDSWSDIQMVGPGEDFLRDVSSRRQSIIGSECTPITPMMVVVTPWPGR